MGTTAPDHDAQMPAGLEEDLAELYDAAPCGYLSTLPDGTIIKVNQTFLTWIAYDRTDVVGRTRFQDLLTIAGKIFHETHYAPLLRMQGQVSEIALDVVDRAGRVVPVLVSTTQKRSAEGTPLLNRTTIFNASDRRAYERELQRARADAEAALAVRDYFLSVASHELKTPLTSILGNIQLLQRRVNRENSLQGRDQRTLQIIADQTSRLNKMVHALLDISRIETGQLAIERGTVDICALLYRLVDEVQTTVGERQMEIRTPLPSIIVPGDDLRLEQVFQNLIQNAVRYSAPPTPILITIQSEETRVAIAVADQGIGIPATALPHVFGQFYRAANAHSRSAAGMGIGLYIVQQIIQLHGGEIVVDSTPDVGSVFTVRLPRA